MLSLTKAGQKIMDDHRARVREIESELGHSLADDDVVKEHGYTDGELDKLAPQVQEKLSAMERNRDKLLADERECGVAFTNAIGERIDPTRVFKSVAGTFADDQGQPAYLWKSESS